MRNTCLVALQVALEMFGVSDPWPDPNQLTSLGRSETMALAPGQERAFYHHLGQHPATDLHALNAVPTCWIESGRPSGQVELRRCTEIAIEKRRTRSANYDRLPAPKTTYVPTNL